MSYKTNATPRPKTIVRKRDSAISRAPPARKNEDKNEKGGDKMVNYNGKKYVCQQDLIEDYFFTKKIIDTYLPDPILLPNPYVRGSGRMMRTWLLTDVRRELRNNSALADAMQHHLKRIGKLHCGLE